MSRILRVAIDRPVLVSNADDAEGGLLDYRSDDAASGVGTLVLVPFGARTEVGVVVEVVDESSVEATRLRDISARVVGLPALSRDWIALARFAADYYHRPIGEVMLPSLPAVLRRAGAYESTPDVAGGPTASLPAIARAQRRAAKAARHATTAGSPTPAVAPLEIAAPDAATPENALSEAAASAPRSADARPADTVEASALRLNAMQAVALERIVEVRRAGSAAKPILLHGITGSGKTEVYLRAIAETIAAGRQALVLVPEINLTPQLQETFTRRLPRARIGSLHSGIPDGQRLHQWLLAHEGTIDVLVGTRMAVLASLPRLGLIVVDEEHDASYKQQEGLRYSARDLAIVRASRGCEGRPFPVVLASATPSMETWARAEAARYERLVLAERASEGARLPTIRLVPTLRTETEHGLTATVRDAIADRIARREPVLVFHNRRGYAPVLACAYCGWLSGCPRCSVHAVFHKADRHLHCHHCGWQRRVPRACPQCGNADLAAVGRGTQRIEESLQALFPGARIARLDRDSTRRKGVATRLLDAVHEGDLDLLVGTQMLAKGHDFRNVTLVCVLDADSALYSHDFRAGERLFSNLMQVAGRAGRGGARAGDAEVLIQTRAPDHPLFAALVAHDFERFAGSELAERRIASLPPFSFQAIVRAEARDAAAALAFLAVARESGVASLADAEPDTPIEFYDPVPSAVARVAHVERAQLLVECASRPALREFLSRWLPTLRDIRPRNRWHVEVDPLDI